jgi:predicted kinase
MIVIMAGLPGTGKTSLGIELATRVSGTVVSKDIIRHTLFQARDVEYSTEQDDFCMEVMLQAARYILKKHPQRMIFLDGRTFSRNYQIQRVLQTAAELNQPWKILECRCLDETARRRLESQSHTGEHAAANRNYQLYLQVKNQFEEITLPKAVINTDKPLNASIAQALAALSSSS